MVRCSFRKILPCIQSVESATHCSAEVSGMSEREEDVTVAVQEDLIMQSTDDLAKIVLLVYLSVCPRPRTRLQGKPLAEAVLEIKYGASFVE